MFGVGLIICAVMFVGMLAAGGPHRMMSFPERFSNSVTTDERREQIDENRKPMVSGTHDHAATNTDGGDEDAAVNKIR